MHTHPGINIEPHNEFSLIENDPEEQEFQEYIDAVFATAAQGKSVDTTGWCTYRINCARFNLSYMNDTLRIPLIDTSLNRTFTYPLKTPVTSPFGPRGSFWHFGTDFQVYYRDTIRAAFDGIVRVVTNDRYGYGNVVVIRHHYGLETLYGHLTKSLVKNNQEIHSGDPIGLGGRTGRATGRHLHLEIRFCGEPFDPATILDYNTYSLKTPVLAITRADFGYMDDLRQTVFHTIRKGDNLGRIAKTYRTSINRLCRLNGITPKTLLKIGRKLIIRKEQPQEFSQSGKRSGQGS
ncbi:MAG: peptidoglycan DD-metalloendopeptidase family protein [Chitinispirillaceae bacterium]|nr:peptidoglycan DD-metalloendopeptidase family protein [Chitinispirillaceae bacterium]